MNFQQGFQATLDKRVALKAGDYFCETIDSLKPSPGESQHETNCTLPANQKIGIVRNFSEPTIGNPSGLFMVLSNSIRYLTARS